MMALRYHDDTPLTDHLNNYQGIINQLAAMGIKFDDEIQALWLLGTLPDSWETFRMSLSNSAPDGKMTMNSVKSSALNEEMRRKTQGSSSNADALVFEKRGRNESRGSKNRDKSRDKSRGKSNRFANVECYHCHAKGHIKKHCRKFKRDSQNGSTEKRSDESNGDRVATVSGDYLIVWEGDEVNFVCQDTSWVVDTGATIHGTSRRDLFTSYRSGDFGTVKMGDDGLATVAGIGDVCLQTCNGTRLMLYNVRHIPSLRLNLISPGVLDSEGYCSTFKDGQWKLTKGSMVIARASKNPSLYILQAKLSGDRISAVDDEESVELWHRRLGHISEKGLNFLSNKNLLPGIKSAALRKCSHCLAGKQNRVAFRSSPPSRKSGILDLVHSDVCGPMKTKSLGGSIYFVTFIDDFSRKIWVYTLKTKDQVAGVFREFHALVERQTGKKLKCIRTDNGGEYIGCFAQYCRQHGIRHQRTPPKTPQLNGIAERMNKTLIERVRCLLSQAQLSKSFWAEALSTVVHILNLTPCVPLDFDIPNRVWTGKDVSYDHLRVFGCKAFVHIPKDDRSKLDSKSRQCIFIGYGLDEFGYKLYDPVEKKIIRSRDVVFVEDQTIQDIQKSKMNSGSEVHHDLVDLNSFPLTRAPVQVDELQQEGDAHVPVEVDADDVTSEPEISTDFSREVPVGRPVRNRRPSSRYPFDEYVMLTDAGDPECYQEAVESEQKKYWLSAMHEEMDSLQKNHTYDLVELPKGKKLLKNKWVFKLKSHEGKSQPRYKARLVVKGFGQRQGIDFTEIFSPVVKMTSIRVALGLAACQDLEIEQMDVKTAFLHGDLDEEIYMEQPEGFKVKNKENLVCRLKKSLYGLKQAPRQWYKKFDSFMTEKGYTRTTSDHCVYMKRFGEDFNVDSRPKYVCY